MILRSAGASLPRRGVCQPVSRLICAAALLVAACSSQPPRGDAAPTGSASLPAASTTAAAPAASAVAPVSLDAGVPSDAGDAEASGDAGATGEVEPAAPIVADNQVKPTEGPELQQRARALFDAIAKNEPKVADPFWFPKEPFIPLKDIKDPGKYWEQLHRTYAADVRALHKKRKSWDGATFVRFDVGSKPKWVKPGDEANKIGYYRSFHGSLRYAIDGKEHTIDVHTVITWQGRWHITHLRKFKK